MIWLSDKNATSIKPLNKTYTVAWKEITFESGKLALLINGAVTISDKSGNVLLVTAGFKEEGVNENADFFPLVVDYQEKFYATWKIGGNRFQKREWRPSNEATLTARLIDRPIRPMFPKGIVNDTQILVTVLSAAWESELGFFGITWASLALMMWGTPFEGPVSWVKVITTKDWKQIFDPTTQEESESRLTLTVAGTLDAITMVEAEWDQVSDEEMIAWLEFAHGVIKEMCNAQIDFIDAYREAFGIRDDVEVFYNKADESLYEKVKEFLTEEKMEVLYNKGKKEFQKALDNLDVEVREFLKEKWHIVDEASNSIWDKCSIEEVTKIEENEVWALVYKRVKEVMRKGILDSGKRLDARKTDEVRTVIWETGLLPRTHGSALFQRGMTQALTIATLGWPDDAELVDGMMPESTRRYIHHYNFPPFSVWEVRMMRGVGRREIGHGKLAERALVPVIPSEEEFPYVMRVVSEITTCNGSSSMASVCGSTMSLMNAWVPIKAPVAWVAMGMIYDEKTGNYKILSDIQAQEDFLWDMDFKVARTKNGITAMQLDVKIKGLSMDVFREAFKQSETAISYILWEMLSVQGEVASQLSPYAPLIMSMQIKEEQIKVVIGKWGENVQRMEKDYGVKISIAEDGLTTITAPSQESGQKAIKDIESLLWEPEIWYKWVWKVVKIIDWTWAIVEFKWKNTGMIHISKLSDKRVEKVEDVVKVWEDVDIEIIQVDKMKWTTWLKVVKVWTQIQSL